MGYIAPEIKDRIAVGDNKYATQTLPDNRTSLTPAPDIVTEPGTDINKALLQPAFDAIAAHDIAVNTTIPQSITDAVTGNTHGWETNSFTTANFSNKQYAIAVPYKRFLLKPSVGLEVDTTYTAYYYDRYTHYLVCDTNTLTMLGWYYYKRGDPTASDSRDLTFGSYCGLIYAQAKTNSDDLTVRATITATGLTIGYYGSATLSSLNGDIKIMQI